MRLTLGTTVSPMDSGLEDLVGASIRSLCCVLGLRNLLLYRLAMLPFTSGWVVNGPEEQTILETSLVAEWSLAVYKHPRQGSDSPPCRFLLRKP